MYRRIGRKIKALAKIIAWIGIIASVIFGVTMIASGNDGAAIIGIVVIIAGALLSWIGSFVLYGYGQLVDNSDTLVENNEKILKLLKEDSYNASAPNPYFTDSMEQNPQF